MGPAAARRGRARLDPPGKSLQSPVRVMAGRSPRETIAASASEKGGSEVLQWMPRLRLALIVLVVLAIALTFGVSWAAFLEW